MVNGVNLKSKRIKELRESNLTVADLRMQIGFKNVNGVTKPIETKSQVRNLGRAVQRQVDKSTPRTQRFISLSKTKIRKKPTD